MNSRLWLSRLLMLRAGEARVMVFLYAFSLIAGFGLSVGHASSDALFFKLYGMEHLPHMYALIALILAPACLVYAAVVDRLTPHRLFVYMLVVIGAVMAMAWLAMMSVGKPGIALYFVAYGVVSELLLTHVYLYLASFFDAQQAKRLLPSAMGVFLAGRIGGGLFVGITGATLPTQHAALIWALIFGLLAAMLIWRHRGEPAHVPVRRGHAVSPLLMLREGLMFARASRLAKAAAAGMFLLVMVLSIQEYVAGRIFVEHFTDERQLASFFGWLSAWTNIGVLAVQLLLFGRLSERFGLQAMNLIFPVTSLLTLGLMAVSPSLTSAILGRVNSRGVLGGVRNNIAGLMYQALPGHMQGRMRALMTGLILPLGLLAAALFLWLVPQEAPLGWVAGGGFVVAAALFWVKLKKNRAYADSLLDMIGDAVFTEDSRTLADIGRIDRRMISRLAAQMRAAGSLLVLNSHADMLERLAHDHAGPAMLEIYPDLPTWMQDALLPRLARLAPPGWETVAWDGAQQGDAHLAETTVRLLLAARYPEARQRAADWLEAAAPRLRAAVALGCLHADDPVLRARARDVLQTLLASTHPADYLPALDGLASMPYPELAPQVRPMLVCEHVRARALALDIWSHAPHNTADEAVEIIDWSLADAAYEVRAAAIQAAARLPFAGMPMLDWLSRAMQDTDYRVRAAGRRHASRFVPQSGDAWRAALDTRQADFELQAVLIQALAASDLDHRDSLLRQAADGHVRQARDKLLILQGLSGAGGAEPAARLLLKQVLREESRRHLDLVLDILGCLDPSQSMHCVRAGLASRDRQLWAQAMESALQFRKENGMIRELARLFEAQRAGTPLTGKPPGGSRAPSVWRAWCQQHGSAWLAECARYDQSQDVVSS